MDKEPCTDCQDPNRECRLFDYQKIFDGLIQITSDQSEYDIREEVVRLVQLKDICTHRLELLTPSSFSFVKVIVKSHSTVVLCI